MSLIKFIALKTNLDLGKEYPGLWSLYSATRHWMEMTSFKVGLVEAITAFCEEHVASLSNSLISDGSFADFVSAVLGPENAKLDWGATTEDWRLHLVDIGMPASTIEETWDHLGVHRKSLEEFCKMLKIDGDAVTADLDRLAKVCAANK